VCASPRRRGFTEVNKGIGAIGQVDGHKAAITDIASAGINHCLRVANCHRSIYRIATHFQDVGPDL